MYSNNVHCNSVQHSVQSARNTDVVYQRHYRLQSSHVLNKALFITPSLHVQYLRRMYIIIVARDPVPSFVAIMLFRSVGLTFSVLTYYCLVGHVEVRVRRIHL